MTSSEKEHLRRRVRTVYELARARRALGASMLTVPMVVVSSFARGPSLATLASGALLFVAVFAMVFVGGYLARGVFPGLLAGVPPLLVPLVLHCAGHACALTGCAGCACPSVCLPACIAAGAAAGAIVGVATMTEAKHPMRTLLSSALVAILAGSLGCMFAGAFGVVAMGLATLGASAPVSVLVRRRLSAG